MRTKTKERLTNIKRSLDRAAANTASVDTLRDSHDAIRNELEGLLRDEGLTFVAHNRIEELAYAHGFKVELYNTETIADACGVVERLRKDHVNWKCWLHPGSHRLQVVVNTFVTPRDIFNAISHLREDVNFAVLFRHGAEFAESEAVFIRQMNMLFGANNWKWEYEDE